MRGAFSYTDVHLHEKFAQLMQLRDLRQQTLKHLEEVIRKHFGLQYEVRAFGSTCYGAGRLDSDVDVCILVRERGPYILVFY